MSQTNLYMPLTIQCAMEHFTCISTKTVQSYTVLIQLNSETLFKDGDPVSLKLIFPGAIQTTYNPRQTQLTLSYKTYPHSYLTYTMYIQFIRQSIINE